MLKSENVFVCIGALHYDYLLKLKNKITNFRTNPISQLTKIGGVAYNVAKILSVFEKVNFYSFKISNELKKEICNRNLKIIEINKKKSERYYLALSDKQNRFLLGLANTNIYENQNVYKFPKNIRKKIIILDLNFNKKFIENTIKKLFIKNTIIVCGTSIHKIYKIKNILKYIDILFLNKSEIFKLTEKKNLLQSIKKINNKNNNIKICTTDGKNNVYFSHNKKILKIKPPKIKIKDENGAGDALAGMMIYLISKNVTLENILKISIACGAYYASGKKIKNKRNLLQIKNFSKKVIIK